MISAASGNGKFPEDRRLSRFSDATVPLFRVKVVDRRSAHGRILASLDKIRPESVDSLPAGSDALLFVEYDDLGNHIWQLDLEGDWPVLRLNQMVEEVSLVASTNAEFFALVYPEVFRQVLTRILVTEEHTDPDCDDDWPQLVAEARGRPARGGHPPAAKSEHPAWIDAATEAFAAKFDLLKKFNLSLEGRR